MIRLMIGILTAALFVTGCDACKSCLSGDKPATGAISAKEVDVCPMCPGVQHMTADGKCDKCGMAIHDDCPNCPGIQMKTADGTCPMCQHKVP